VPALFLCVFLPAFGTHGLNPVLPEMERALGLQGQSLPTLLSSAFSLGATLAYLSIGPLSDRRGRSSMLLQGVFWFACVHLATAFVSSAPLLALGRLLAGFAGGTVFVLANALVVDHTSYAHRGRSMSFVWLGIPAAMVIGVPLSAYLAGVRWNAYFYLAGRVRAAHLDRGAARAAADRSDATSGGPPSGFVPIRRFLHRPPLVLAAASSFAVTVAMFLLLSTVAAAAMQEFQFSPTMRANLFVVLGIGGVTGGLISGGVADAIGKKTCVIVPLALAAIAVVAQSFAREPWLFTTLAILLSLLTTLRQGPYQAIVTELVPAGERGSYLAITLTSASLGTWFGQAIAGKLFDTMGFSGVARAAAGLLVLASLLFMLVPEPAGAHPPHEQVLDPAPSPDASSDPGHEAEKTRVNG
jgi:predicted MFS family arabinose efflux permease